MGNQPSSSIPPELLTVEINYIKSQQLCSAGLRTEIDADVEVMLRSVGQPLPGQTIQGGRLEPEIKEVLLDRINEYRLSDEVDQRFFDPQLMSMITCLYGNLLTVDKELFRVTAAGKEYFRLTDNLSIGNWGIVFKARNSGAELNFIIKTQVNPRLADLSIHEVFAALKAINPLRAYCPNFSVLYGGFICGKPDGISGLLCGGRDNVPYTIYEAVPGNTLYRAIANLVPIKQSLADMVDVNYAEILCAMLQIYFALKTAHLQAFEFSHRDLHVENIIMRPLNKTMLLRYRSQLMKPFQLNNQTIPITADYYLRTNHVATIIDYDNCEIYLPIVYGPNDIRTTRFGGADLDPLGPRPISGDPNLSHLRDLAKILGFAAYFTWKSKASDEFKLLMANIYLQTIQPAVPDKYRVNNPDASTLNIDFAPCDYDEVLTRERESFFQVTHQQVRLNREGRLSFDNFLEVFLRLVPQSYQSYILAIDGQPVSLGDVQNDLRSIENVEQRLGLEVLGCKPGQCASDVETYRKIVNPQDEAKLAARKPFEPENLSYQLLDVKKATLRLDNDFRSGFKAVEIAPQANNRQLTVKYRDVLTAKLLLAEAELTADRAQGLGYKINAILQSIQTMLRDFQLPNHQDFHKLYPKGSFGIDAYRKVIDRAFKLIAAVTQARAIHESLVTVCGPSALSGTAAAVPIGSAQSASRLSQPDDINRTYSCQVADSYRPELTRNIDAVNAFIQGQFTPWRDELLRLVNSRFFGESNNEMARIILTKVS